MANYNCVQRTNYFHVKDPEAFRNMMDSVVAEDLKLWEENGPKGKPVFAFGCYGEISGILHKDQDGEMNIDDNSYDDFICRLQGSVAEDDSIILIEAGHEKLRYLVDSALIITSKSTRYINLMESAFELARKMLDNPEYTTRLEY